jgi:hypothetical protein
MVIDAVLDKTIDKIRVKIRHLSVVSVMLWTASSLTPATIDPMRVSVPVARFASNMLRSQQTCVQLRRAIERISALIVTNDE